MEVTVGLEHTMRMVVLKTIVFHVCTSGFDEAEMGPVDLCVALRGDLTWR